MELNEVLETLRANAAQYIHAFAEILTSPRLYFLPVAHESTWRGERQAAGAEGPNQKEKTLLNANLLVFGAISVFLGSAVWQYLVGKEDPLPLTARVALVLVLWCLIGAGAHVVCRLVGGKASATDTLAATIQTLAVTYVIGTVLTLVLVSVGVAPVGHHQRAPKQLADLAEALSTSPQKLYAAIQCTLLLVFLPPVLRGIHRLTRSRTVALLVVPFLASTVSFLVWNGRPGAPPAAAPPPPTASSPVTSLAGSPEPVTTAGGDVVPVQRLMPQPGHALIRYFEHQSAQPPHVSFVERSADSTQQLFWFPFRECESERKCPYEPWWRKPDVNVIVVPGDFVVGILERHNACHGRLNINPDSDYSLACQGQRLRVVSAPTMWRGRGPLPRTEWLAPPWNPQDDTTSR
ncbi:MAG TPA: hypothetical protein VH539_13450 [Gemmatimonadaceae bacterium]|jgi:hypothetical protein